MAIDELTALIKTSGSSNWDASRKGKAYFLKGLKEHQLVVGDEVNF